jgi:ubiquinone/menaquinone biosynthesis C-methylase UbiE
MKEDTKKSFTSPDDLIGTIMTFRQSRVILSAFELGLFSAFHGTRKTSAAVARRLGTDLRGTDRLMNALSALGLLRKNGQLFSNTSFSAEYLVKGKPRYMAGLEHAAGLWHRWSSLTQAVCHGGRVTEPELGDREKERSRTEGFIASMHQRASVQAPRIVLLIDLSGVKRILDIGGGSGAFSIEFVRAKKDIQATVFDLPEVIPLTRKYVRKAGLSHRFTFIPGDFDHDNFGSGYDIAFLSAIIHMNSLPQNLRLFKKCARALAPGGRLVVSDYIMSQDRTKPAYGTFFALNMLVNTKAGDTYTEQEVRAAMKKAGLTRILRKATPFDSSLMIGIKPGKENKQA